MPQAPSVGDGFREGDAPLDYDRALRLVMGLADFERSTHSPGHGRFHLERVRLLLSRLGDPHLKVPTVHVAGTKGKGSTAAMVTAILTAHGYRTGLFTSPHLHSAVERIRVGLEPVSKGAFARLVARAWPHVEWVGRQGGYGEVTTFELLTAMAFLHFHEVGADFQVVEVGLGGRLDSTNVVRPQVCAITSISLDHVTVLGDTVPSIAAEKAGIIKDGVPVVVAPQPQEAMAVFRRTARERGAPLVSVAEAMSWEKVYADPGGQSFDLRGLEGRYRLWMPLLGDYQLENAATAVAVVETLRRRGFAVAKESVVQGLRQVRWPARLEVLRRGDVTVVVDGAHNPYSMRRLVEALPQYFRWRRLWVVFGALGGHSARGMAWAMAPLGPQVLATRSRHPRSASGDIISGVTAEAGLPVVHRSEVVAEAYRRALELAEPGDMVLGTGSLSVAAEVIEEERGIPPELYPYIKGASRPDPSKVT